MNPRNLTADARAAVRAEFGAEAVRLGATVRAEGGSLMAVWPEACKQTTSATLAMVGERFALIETAVLPLPEGFPEDWAERFGHRSAAVGRLRDHLAMVERVTGVPLILPPEPLRVVRA